MGVFIYKTRGSKAEVGYVTDEKLVGDILDLDYEEYSRGLIHSHNEMGTSFSTTDTEQLKLAASTSPYYLSVVVNNDMEFTAKVAIKCTTEGTVKSYFRDLKNKLISKPKEVKYDSYTIEEVEVEADFPQYMTDVDDRIKNRLQEYITPTYHKAVGTGNSIKGKEVWNENDIFKKPSYATPFNRSIQPSLFKDTKPASAWPIEGDDILDTFIEAALEEYCKNLQGIVFTPEICAKNIVEDAKHYGISIDDYIGYLEVETFIDLDTDNNIMDALNKYKK